tara:strand:+ start:1102 stop:1260 length:159 start_codon:yes stop_codon:yes gene_type:complete
MADKYAVGVKKKDGSYKWIPFNKVPKMTMQKFLDQSLNKAKKRMQSHASVKR